MSTVAVLADRVVEVVHLGGHEIDMGSPDPVVHAIPRRAVAVTAVLDVGRRDRDAPVGIEPPEREPLCHPVRET